ncbi:unnamed protein product, partial [Meganyctiphanes norvegica]
AMSQNDYIIHPASRHSLHLCWDISKSRFQLCDEKPHKNISLRFVNVPGPYRSTKYLLMLQEKVSGNHSLILNATNIQKQPNEEEHVTEDVKFDVLKLDNKGNIALVVKTKRKIWWLCHAALRQVALCSGTAPTVFGTWTVIEVIENQKNKIQSFI